MQLVHVAINLYKLQVRMKFQKWCQHFKSGQVTANKRSLVHVQGGGVTTGKVQQ